MYDCADKIHKIEKFGRVNKPKESMFYGSLNIPTACCEAISKGNVFQNSDSTMLTVGVWKFTKPVNLVQIPHSEKYFTEFYDKVNFKSEKIQLEDIRKNNDVIRKQFADDFEFEKLMFFADQFAKWDITNDYEYKLSNYFADRALGRIEGYPLDQNGEAIDGIIYPSIALSYQEKNIVLLPEVAEKKLEFIEAVQVWLVSFLKRQGGAQFIPIRQKVKSDHNGKLLWEGGYSR